MPTKKPVLHLISENSVGHNEYGEKISSGYYKIHNLEELQNVIDKVIIKGEDPLYEERMESLKLVYKPDGSVASFIVNHISAQLEDRSKE